jgi:hypothetical protein
MTLLLIILILFLLFGGGVGYYGPRNDWGAPHYGGLVGLLLIVLLILLLFSPWALWHL